MSQASERAVERNQDRLLEKANVVGVGDAGDHVVVLVTEKKPLEELDPADVVDPELEGVETDVIQVGKVRPMQRLNPGTSIGIAQRGTGTLGAVVQDDQGALYGLTNNHVAADSNRVLAGSTQILSPGPADGAGTRIGNLARFEPIWFNRPNLVDAALVRLNPGISAGDTPAIPRRVVTAGIGWNVQKHGRTTGHNWGTVLARGVTVDVDFGSQGVARFVDQVLTTPMLWPGDSGSVLLTSGGFPCALGFAGSDTVSIHSPLALVLRTLAVRMAA
jgi:hypothetical protein